MHDSSSSTTASAAQVAIYWDIENVHAALIDHLQGSGAYRLLCRSKQKPYLQVDKIMDYVATLGDVVVNRAYAHWRWLECYADALLIHAVDLVQMFPRGRHSKNGADIRLALDVMEDCLRFGNIDKVVIVSGDSDYISLAQKVRQLGKLVVGIGVKRSTNDYWVKSCNDFKFYNHLVGKIAPPVDPLAARPRSASSSATSVHGNGPGVRGTHSSAGSARTAESARSVPEKAKELLVRAVRALTLDRNENWVVKAQVPQTMKRLDSSFDARSFGYKTFADLVDACGDVITQRKGSHDNELALVEGAERIVATQSTAMADGNSLGPTTAVDVKPADPPLRVYQRCLRRVDVPLVPFDARWPIVQRLHAALMAAETGASIPTSPVLDDLVMQALADAGHPAELRQVKRVRTLAHRAKMIRIGGDGIRLRNPSATAGELERGIVRWLIAVLAKTAGGPLDAAAVQEFLYGEAPPPFGDLEELIAEVRQEQ